MLGRRRSAAVRHSTGAAARRAPTRLQAIALTAALAGVAGTIAVASYTVRPERARAFDLFYGTLVLDDDTAPVAVDLATGRPTVRLTQAYTQVGARRSGDLTLTPLSRATLMLDTATGEFNMIDGGGFVVKPGGGVALPGGGTGGRAIGVAADDSAGDAAYVVRSGGGGTEAFLVGPATVAAARAPGTQATARGYARLDEAVEDAPGARVGAGGELWLLAGTGRTRTIVRLALPEGADPGVRLQRSEYGRVHGPAALAEASEHRDGSGGHVVGVASADTLTVLRPDGTRDERRIEAPAGVDAVRPATAQRGRLQFLLHSPSGWSLVDADASPGAPQGQLRAVPLPALPAAAPLAVPAASGAALYTLQTDTGALWRIATTPGQGEPAAAPVPGIASYPLLDGERGEFTHATVTARGDRVVFNARANLQALTVFTDGSHLPVLVDKRTAVDLDASGSLTLLDRPRPQRPTPGPSPQPQQSAITDHIDCASTTQVPHIPVTQLLGRAARSVRVQWSYPLLDRQDCAPSTYTVRATLVHAGSAPDPPPAARVQGQTGVNLTGLFPDTEYRIVVTAYINGKGTPSAPLVVRTGPEGPAAPTDVRATVDDAGNWIVSWTSCGGARDGCVPAAGWTVIPHLCDGQGLSAPPPPASTPGETSQRHFTLTYPAGSELLGRGLSFQVEGVGTRGDAGTTSQTGGCSYSWARPRADLVDVRASAPPATGSTGTSTTTASVTFTGDRTLALGGRGGQLVYRLLSGGDVVSSAGPTDDTTVQLPGLRPGQRYQLSVRLVPPRHPEATLTLAPVDVVPAIADWPALTLTASFRNTSASRGELALAFGGLASADARGETFDLADAALQCGNTRLPLDASSFDPADPVTIGDVDRSVYNGDCTLTARLAQNPGTATDPPVFGAGPSPQVGADLTVPAPTTSVTASDFDAVWSGSTGSPAITISYDGADPLLKTFATQWSLRVDNGSGTCGAAAKAPPAKLAVDKACVKAGGPFSATVSFRYFGKDHTFTLAVHGTAPAPLQLAAGDFTAQWDPHVDADGNARLTVGYTGSADLAAGGSDWKEVVLDPAASPCGSAQSVPSASGPVLVVDGACLGPTPSSGWTVRVTYTDANTAETKTVDVPAPGLPPAHP